MKEYFSLSLSTSAIMLPLQAIGMGKKGSKNLRTLFQRGGRRQGILLEVIRIASLTHFSFLC